MSPNFAILLCSLAISLLATPLVRNAAMARGMLDQVGNSRKVHTRAVPRLGGVGIVLGIYGAFGFALLFLPRVQQIVLANGATLLWLALAGLVIAVLGMYDDVRGSSAKVKFAVQFGVALALYRAGYRIDYVDGPFQGYIALGALSLPVTLLWIAGVSNALNLIDGLDGLAGGMALAGVVAVFAISRRSGDVPGALVAMALAGGIIGFLAYNVNPASIFMGDTGSLFLGTIVAAVTLRPHGAGRHTVPLFAMCIALAIPLADTAVAMLRRWARGAPLFAADREHLHHKLLGAGFTHRGAVLALWIAASVLSWAAIQISSGNRLRGAMLFGAALGGGFALVRLGMVRWPDAVLRERRQRNRLRLAAVHVVVERIRFAPDLATIRHELDHAAAALDARAITLNIESETARAAYRAPKRNESRSRFVLDAARPTWAVLDVTWAELGLEVDRDAEIAFEILAERVANAVNRVEHGRGRPSWLRAVLGGKRIERSAA